MTYFSLLRSPHCCLVHSVVQIKKWLPPGGVLRCLVSLQALYVLPILSEPHVERSLKYLRQLELYKPGCRVSGGVQPPEMAPVLLAEYGVEERKAGRVVGAAVLSMQGSVNCSLLR